MAGQKPCHLSTCGGLRQNNNYSYYIRVCKQKLSVCSLGGRGSRQAYQKKSLSFLVLAGIPVAAFCRSLSLQWLCCAFCCSHQPSSSRCGAIPFPAGISDDKTEASTSDCCSRDGMGATLLQRGTDSEQLDLLFPGFSRHNLKQPTFENPQENLSSFLSSVWLSMGSFPQ